MWCHLEYQMLLLVTVNDMLLVEVTSVKMDMWQWISLATQTVYLPYNLRILGYLLSEVADSRICRLYQQNTLTGYKPTQLPLGDPLIAQANNNSVKPQARYYFRKKNPIQDRLQCKSRTPRCQDTIYWLNDQSKVIVGSL